MWRVDGGQVGAWLVCSSRYEVKGSLPGWEEEREGKREGKRKREEGREEGRGERRKRWKGRESVCEVSCAHWVPEVQCPLNEVRHLVDCGIVHQMLHA